MILIIITALLSIINILLITFSEFILYCIWFTIQIILYCINGKSIYE